MGMKGGKPSVYTRGYTICTIRRLTVSAKNTCSAKKTSDAKLCKNIKLLLQSK